MIFNVITLLVALSISGVAIYYSVAGLAAIFAASVIPVIIMGGVLEVGKLVAAVWLHRNWKTSVFWLKWYLGTAVAVLMFITSMGIFGFLSKSHVEQTAATAENVAQIERITGDIARQRAIISRSEERIEALESSTGGVDGNLQTQIDREQERIDTAYTRVEPTIQAQLDIIATEDAKQRSLLEPYELEIENITTLLADLQEAITAGEIRKAQQIVGTNPDGRYGPKTAERVDVFRDEQQAKLESARQNIERLKSTSSSTRTSAQAEIERIRSRVDAEVSRSNELIARLKTQLGQTSRQDIDKELEEQLSKIRTANDELDELVAQKVVIESTSRQLEAEVGPIKYIAEFIYRDEADTNLLEEAVRWVIIIIIFVFDPLAVGLLIASQYSFEDYARRKKEKAEKAPDPEPEPEPEKDTRAYEEYLKVMDMVVTETEYSELPEVKGPKPIPKKRSERHNKTIWPSEIETVQEEPSVEPSKEDAEKPVKESDKPATVDPQPEPLTPAAQPSIVQVEQEKVINHFSIPVASGINFPEAVQPGKLFMRLDEEPTALYEYNGQAWDAIDKNLLEYTAYTDKYIEALVKRIADNKYNLELLNEAEKLHIEDYLTRTSEE